MVSVLSNVWLYLIQVCFEIVLLSLKKYLGKYSYLLFSAEINDSQYPHEKYLIKVVKVVLRKDFF